MFLDIVFGRRSSVIRARKYSHAAILARFIVYGLLCCMLIGGASGCATGSEQRAAETKSPKSQAEQLYQAILKAYSERGLQVDIASEDLLLVSSRYEKLGPDLRRRYVSRVLGLQAGIALNVTAEYQRGNEVDGEQQWQLIEDEDPLKKQAVGEEVDLGRAVERAFHK